MKPGTLEKHARAGTLEVEHLLAAARTPDAALADLLDTLRVELAWPGAIDGHAVPLGGWAMVVAVAPGRACRGRWRGTSASACARRRHGRPPGTR